LLIREHKIGQACGIHGKMISACGTT